MGLFSGDDERFTFLEYQALMLVLAAAIGLGFLAVELGMKRYNVLTVLFPGMFSIRERRFFFFDFEIRDAALASHLRAKSRVLLRMTLCVVMSYLWQRCVLETSQQVGRKFPSDLCDLGMDCFASELDVTTLLTRSYEPVNCTGPRSPYPQRMVFSCVQFVQPSATDWLMHIAIAQSVTQLNIKCFEVFVQFAGNHRWIRRSFAISFYLTFVLLLILFLTGVMSQFVSSWLSFVMTLSVPTFLWCVWRTSMCFQDLWQKRAEELQSSIEENLKSALEETPGETKLQETQASAGRGVVKMSSKAAQMAKTFFRMSGVPGFPLPRGASTRRRRTSGLAAARTQSDPVLPAASSLLPPIAPEASSSDAKSSGATSACPVAETPTGRFGDLKVAESSGRMVV